MKHARQGGPEASIPVIHLLHCHLGGSAAKLLIWKQGQPRYFKLKHTTRFLLVPFVPRGRTPQHQSPNLCGRTSLIARVENIQWWALSLQITAPSQNFFFEFGKRSAVLRHEREVNTTGKAALPCWGRVAGCASDLILSSSWLGEASSIFSALYTGSTLTFGWARAAAPGEAGRLEAQGKH